MKLADFINFRGDEYKPALRTTESVFQNAECLFIQYHDILRCPWFSVMRILKEEPPINKIFLFDEITDDIGSQFEWYIHRRDRYFFDSLPSAENVKIDYKALNNLLRDISEHLLKACPDVLLQLSPVIALNILFQETQLVKKVIIWEETGIRNIADDIYRLFPKANRGMFNIKSGVSIYDAIKDAPKDSTYFISDINIIPVLQKEDKLSFSSIILGHYDYNYDMKTEKLKVDVEALEKENVFKFNEISTTEIFSGKKKTDNYSGLK